MAVAKRHFARFEKRCLEGRVRGPYHTLWPEGSDQEFENQPCGTLVEKQVVRQTVPAMQCTRLEAGEVLADVFSVAKG